MTEPFEVFEPDRHHLPEMITLRRETQRSHHALLPHVFPEEVPDADIRKEMEQFLKRRLMLGRRNTFALACEDDRGLVGYTLFTINNIDGGIELYRRRVCHIVDLAVAERARRYGVARSLLQRVGVTAREYDADVIKANVWSGNEASAAVFQETGYECESRVFSMSLDTDREAPHGA